LGRLKQLSAMLLGGSAHLQGPRRQWRHGGPYDLRRTYAQWLDLVRIPQFRQSYYLGHGPKNLDQLYQRMQASSEYLREDAAAPGQLVGGSVVVRLVK
jgi:hypothetical protein